MQGTTTAAFPVPYSSLFIIIHASSNGVLSALIKVPKYNCCKRKLFCELLLLLSVSCHGGLWRWAWRYRSMHLYLAAHTFNTVSVSDVCLSRSAKYSDPSSTLCVHNVRMCRTVFCVQMLFWPSVNTPFVIHSSFIHLLGSLQALRFTYCMFPLLPSNPTWLTNKTLPGCQAVCNAGLFRFEQRLCRGNAARGLSCRYALMLRRYGSCVCVYVCIRTVKFPWRVFIFCNFGILIDNLQRQSLFDLPRSMKLGTTCVCSDVLGQYHQFSSLQFCLLCPDAVFASQLSLLLFRPHVMIRSVPLSKSVTSCCVRNLNLATGPFPNPHCHTSYLYLPF